MESQSKTDLVKSASNSYSIFDKLDEQQIVNADKAVKQKMVYKTKNHAELTFVGLKHIILEMSQHEQPIEIEESTVTLDKDGSSPDMWYWRAKVKVRNQQSNYPSEGLSECPYLENGKYDPFGRTKAHSKAERNAWRKQIPEQRIIELLKAVGPEDIQEVHDGFDDGDGDTQPRYCQCDEICVPNKFNTKCTNCNGVINEYMKANLKRQGRLYEQKHL